MHTTNDARGRLELAASGGEDLPAATAPGAAAPSSLLELLDAESRLLARAVGEHLPLELALKVNELRARRAALDLWAAPSRPPAGELLPDGSSTSAAAGGGTVGAAAERFARLTLAQAPQTQRTYRGCLERFSLWLAEHHANRCGLAVTAAAQAPVEAITADAIAAYLSELEARGLAASTIKKDRAAINRFAKYLHTLRLIDATELLVIDGPRMRRTASTRDSLDQTTWQRVQKIARARLTPDARQRSTPTLAARDLAIIMLLGACGLRNEEAERCPSTRSSCAAPTATAPGCASPAKAVASASSRSPPTSPTPSTPGNACGPLRSATTH